MFLSDELIQKGREANKRSNLSMAEKAKELQAIITSRSGEFTNKKLLANCVKYAVSALDKEGYPLYKNFHFDL